MQHWQQSSYEPYLPVTEKSNPITTDIDRANPKEIVQMLQKCDAELFERTSHGNPMYQTLNSSSVIQTIVDVSKRVEVILKTSLNRWLASHHQKQIYWYIIAGGDKSLLTSQETVEDDPLLGALTLEKACAGKKHVLFFGISCGLSAPFVAGQLDFCLRNLESFTPVLIGFNPVDMARTEPIQNCTFHFKEVAERMNEMQKQQKAYVLNPTVGPEAISGSSRMKGGSATKIILETILLAGHEAACNKKAVTLNGILSQLSTFEKVHQLTYSQTNELAALVQKAAISLQRKGHVYYLGWQTLGIIGIIDACECIPTFGAGFDDIRGFVSNGFSEMNNKEGDLSSLGPHFIIDHKDFVDTILPNLSDDDTVIFLYSENDDMNEVSLLAKSVRQRISNLHAIAHELKGLSDPEIMKNQFMTVLTIKWPSSLYKDNPVLMKQYWELSTKWCLNAISTGAHVIIGKVYMNFMIDLRVTNTKLYRRAIHILQRLTGSTREQCETALLRALYDVEELSDEMSSTDVIRHTLVANERGSVVPLALVMLQSRCTIAEAKSYTDAYSVIRDAVAACQRLL
ncbi:glucokinase regulatory protein isoform X2 [Neoarius graeffei]|uniref:glucokinase regulatory protein isoform X2 n=1 Tax=Neoarius graeffei TaxID=443677 RepID=UPI00298D18E5|nr:glucokinase regulatory protein isoform X2 [Neoarius graeffei]